MKKKKISTFSYFFYKKLAILQTLCDILNIEDKEDVRHA